MEGAAIPSHWAVAVGRDEHWTWYEIELPEEGGKESKGSKQTKIVKNCGREATSGAGPFGGEIVGKTRKADTEIEDFITKYEKEYPEYGLLSTNCQQWKLVFWGDILLDII